LPWEEGKIITHTCAHSVPAAEPYNWDCKESILPISATAAIADGLRAGI